MQVASQVLGIDFGTSKSMMSWFNPRSGQAEIIKNAQGEEKTPSVVYFGQDGLLVGTPAENMLEDEDERLRVFASVKRFLGSSTQFALPDGRQVTAIEMTTAILQKLKQDAETGHFHETINSVVLTCPASFTEQERSILKSAAEKAGFQTVELLEEPVAAALAYGHAGFKCGDNLLVYDLGGGTFDLAVLTRDKRTFRLALEPRGLRCCGGDDFDRAIYDHFDRMARESLQRTISGSESYDLQFLRLCRQRKESLSDRDRCEFSTYLTGGVRFKHSLERSHFESLIEANVKETIQLTRSVVEDAKQNRHEVQTVVLIGGSSRVPLVQRLLSTEARLPVEPQRWQQQDVAVALGAAYYGYSLRSTEGHTLDRRQSASNNLTDLHRKLRVEIDGLSSNGDLTVPARTIAKILSIEPQDEIALQARIKLIRPLLDVAKENCSSINDSNCQLEVCLSIANLEAQIGDVSCCEKTLVEASTKCSTISEDLERRLSNYEKIAALQNQIGAQNASASSLEAARATLNSMMLAFDGVDRRKSRSHPIFPKECILEGRDEWLFFAEAYSCLGDKITANNFFQSAIAQVCTLPADFWDPVYRHIAKSQFDAGFTEAAQDTARRIVDRDVRDSYEDDVAVELAMNHARSAEFSEAVELAEGIANYYKKEGLLEEIVLLQASNLDLGTASTLLSFKDHSDLIVFLHTKCNVLHRDATEHLIGQLIDTLNSQPEQLDEDSYQSLLGLFLMLASSRIRFKDIASAKLALNTALSMLNSREPKWLPEISLASLCAQVGELKLANSWARLARNTIDAIQNPDQKCCDLRNLARCYLHAGDVRSAREIAELLSVNSDDSSNWEVMKEIVDTVARKGDFGNARTLADTIPDTLRPQYRWFAYHEIASNQARFGDVFSALSTASAISDDASIYKNGRFDSIKGFAFLEIVGTQLRAGNIAGAHATALQMEHYKEVAYIAVVAATICREGRLTVSAKELWTGLSDTNRACVYLHAVNRLLSSDGESDIEFLESKPLTD